MQPSNSLALCLILLLFFSFFLPSVLHQELPDEALGQLAGVSEELLVEVVVHGRDVAQCLLLGVAEERRRAAQAGKERQLSDTQVASRLISMSATTELTGCR